MNNTHDVVGMTDAQYENYLTFCKTEKEQEQTELKEKRAAASKEVIFSKAMEQMAKALSTMVSPIHNQHRLADGTPDQTAMSEQYGRNMTRIDELYKLRYSPSKVSWEVYNTQKRRERNEDYLNHIKSQISE
jgi:hypothetical protein